MTDSAYWTTNLDRLAQSQPDLAQHLARLPLCNVNLLPNAQGQLVGQTWDRLGQQWVTLCDPHDPVGEAERDAQALWTRDAKIFVIFGLGLGYFPAALARRLQPHQRLAIFDPSPFHYLASMHAIDMAALQSGQPQVEVFVGDGLQPILEHWWLNLQSHEKFHIAQPMRSGFTQHCDAPTYEQLIAKTEEMLRYHHVGLATWKQFGHCIGDSDLGNLPEYLITPGLEHLQGLWQGKPAVCIAAGPSLQKNLALLMDPAVRNKVAVLTVGTVYALLDCLGIQPDVVTTIDFQRLNWTDQFRHVPLDMAPTLVYLHSTHPSTVRRWPGPRFVGLNASDTTAWMSQYCEPKAYAASVQTVAHLNVVVAQLMGANPIILLGQDLSMPAESHHSLGARAQDTSPQESPDSHMQVPGWDGQPVWTRHSLLSMKTVFEQMIAGTPDRAYVNCTEGGVALAGAAHAPLGAVLEALAPGDGSRLAPLIAARSRAYVPQPKLEAMQTDMAQLQCGLVRLHNTARMIQERHAQYQQAVITGTPEAALAAFQALMACDAVIGQEPLAFGQIAVRCFDIIELLATIPPPPDTSDAEVQRLNVERLAHVAQSILVEVPHVQQVVAQTLRRLDDVALALKPNGHPPATATLWRALARESFISVAQVLRQWPQVEPRLHVQLAWHQQRYMATQALSAAFQLAPHLGTKSAAALARYHAQTQPLIRPYVAALAAGPSAGTPAGLVLPGVALPGEGATGPTQPVAA